MTIFFTSIPKSGTHLLLPILETALECSAVKLDKLRYDEEGLPEDLVDFPLAYGHMRLQSDRKDPDPQVHPVALIRDPRDIVLSMRDYIFRSNAPPHRQVADLLRDLDDVAQLKAIVDGIVIEGFQVAQLDEHCSGFIEWTRFGGVVLRYEDLLTPEAAPQIADAIERPDRLEAIDEALTARLFVGGRTFNQGGSRWRSQMPAEVVDHIATTTQVLVNLGYE